MIGASRTDAGVHARGNVAVFDTESRIPGEKFSYALNQRLPEDVIIQDSCEVTADFHPRHCECRKTYEYTILNRTFPLPEYRNTAFFCYGDLDVERMDQAAKQFVGNMILLLFVLQERKCSQPSGLFTVRPWSGNSRK